MLFCSRGPSGELRMATQGPTYVKMNDLSIIWHSCISHTFHTMVIFLPMQGEHHAAWDGEDFLEQRNLLQQFIERVIIKRKNIC